MIIPTAFLLIATTPSPTAPAPTTVQQSPLTVQRKATAPEPHTHQIGAAIHIGGIERYPLLGLSAQIFRRWGRWRLGGSLHIYMPRRYGLVRRFAVGGEIQGQFYMVDHRRIGWYLAVGAALGFFHDKYNPGALLGDQHSLAPGFSAGTGLELRLSASWAIFAEVRATGYAAKRVADDEWLEFTVGPRWSFGPRSR